MDFGVSYGVPLLLCDECLSEHKVPVPFAEEK